MGIIIFFLIMLALLESFNRVACRMGLRPGIECILGSYTFFWAWVVAVSWTLSIINLLTQEAFGAATLLTVFVLFTFVDRPESFLYEQVIRLSKNAWLFARGKWPYASMLIILVIWCCWGIYRILLLPPNTWDAMTYHLPAIANWLQHGNLSWYETSTMRQVIFPINGELLQMFHVIFLKSDVIIQLVQFECFVMVMCGTYYICRLSGLATGWALNASMVSLTVPLILLESYTTQNDLIVATGMTLSLMWLAVYLERPNIRTLAIAGICLGLMLGTKLHMLIAFAVLLSVFAFIVFQYRHEHASRQNLLWFLGGVLVAASILGSTIYMRNLLRYGTVIPLVPDSESTMERHFVVGFQTMFENVVFFANWWLVRCWDFTSPRVWNRDDSQFGPIFGYLILPLSLAGILVLVTKAIRKERYDYASWIQASILLSVLGTFAGFILSHRPRPHDLRYLLFLPPLLSCVAMWLLAKGTIRVERIVSVVVLLAATLTTTFAMLRDSSSDLAYASSLEPAKRTSTHLGLNNPDQVFTKRMHELVRPGEAILFCGLEDDWSYPLFGNELSHRVYYATSLQSARHHIDYTGINWIAVREQYTEITDYLRNYPTRFRELHFTSVYSPNRFIVFHAEPQDWNGAWGDGIFGDSWCKQTFIVGARLPGTFLITCTVPEVYKDGIQLNIQNPDSTHSDTLLVPSTSYKFLLPLREPGQIVFAFNKTIVPSQFGMGDVEDTVSIRISTVLFYPNPNFPERVQVFPK